MEEEGSGSRRPINYGSTGSGPDSEPSCKPIYNLTWEIRYVLKGDLPGIGRCFGRVQVLDGEDPVVVGGVVKPEIKTTRRECSINFLISMITTYYDLHYRAHLTIYGNCQC
jgi:hypothetical protein